VRIEIERGQLRHRFVILPVDATRTISRAPKSHTLRHRLILGWNLSDPPPALHPVIGAAIASRITTRYI
jgi:hypothetical protein